MKIQKYFKENALLIMIILAVISGILVGSILRSQTNLNKVTKSYFGYPGEIFLRAIKFMILPLISTNIINGICHSELSKFDKIARQTLLMFISTKTLAALLCAILVTSIKPGYSNQNQSISISTASKVENQNSIKLSVFDDILDLIRNMIPENMIEMCFEIYRSKVGIHYKPVHNLTLLNENGIFN